MYIHIYVSITLRNLKDKTLRCFTFYLLLITESVSRIADLHDSTELQKTIK